jgi:hypothetical protein
MCCVYTLQIQMYNSHQQQGCMIRENIVVLMPWPILLSLFSFGVVHWFFFNTRFERKSMLKLFVSVGIERIACMDFLSHHNLEQFILMEVCRLRKAYVKKSTRPILSLLFGHQIK